MNSKAVSLYGWLGLWIVLFAIGWVHSYDFDRTVGIYKFGAVAWPRAVLLVMLLIAIIQFCCGYYTLRRSAIADDNASLAFDIPVILRWCGFLVIPFLFAVLLEALGFYTLAPFFIASYLLLAGERRPKYLVGVTVGLYGILLLVFVKLLYTNLPTGNISPFYDFGNWMVTVIRGNG
ncbi:MAG: tripartite tricarboxylate transporter TctB family protein [Pseudomonadota bacterium]